MQIIWMQKEFVKKLKFLIPPHLLTNFEIQKHYQNELEYSYESIGTIWIDLYVNVKNVAHFDSFGVEDITKEIKKLIGNKNIVSNIYRI